MLQFVGRTPLLIILTRNIILLLGMAARVNAVQDGVAGPVIAALDSSDNTIRCKAANALGSLATARPAADLLLGRCDLSLHCISRCAVEWLIVHSDLLQP